MRQIKLRAIFSLAVATLLGGVGSVASAQATKAKPGEIVVKVPSNLDPATLAKQVNCKVDRPVAYCEGYWVYQVLGRDLQVAEETPKPDVLAAVAALRNMPGVSADPNWMHYPSGYKQGGARAQPRVTRAQQGPGTKITPNDTIYPKQTWHLDMIRMPEAWNIQYGSGNTILVAIIDSGIDSTHPDFKDAAGSSRVVAQQDFSGAGNPGLDSIGHGTHVGGTVAATTNNSIGVTGIAGWNRQGVNVKLINAKVFNTGGASSDTVASAISYSVAQGARVINLSLGSEGPSAAQVEIDAVNSALKANVVVVAAAGNSGLNNDNANTQAWPADITGVIKATAVGPTKSLSSFSNYGGNIRKIAAPGGDDFSAAGTGAIWSTSPLAGSIDFANTTGYSPANGTSMACPHVAGAAALLIAAGVPASGVYQALADGASQAVAARSGIGYTAAYGPGVLDVYSALYPYADPAPTVTVEGGVDRGNSYFGATPISIAVRGVGRIYTSAPPNGLTGLWSLETDLTVTVETVGLKPTVIRTYTGGRGVAGQVDKIEIPVLPTNASRSTSYTGIRVPAPKTDGTYTPVQLSPGQYRIVARLNQRDSKGVVSTLEQVQFITIVEKQLPAGRMMFAMPFKAALATRPVGVTPEAGVLGQSTVFSIARFNPLRSPSDDDYARFRSADLYNLKNAARFGQTDQLDSRVIVFDTTAPTTSIAPIGMGYWLDMDRAGSVNTSLLPYPGQLAGLSPVAENSVGIKAFASGGGWNMIGAPFTYPVDWSVVTVRANDISYSVADAVKAGVISPALIGFGNGDYVYSIAPAGQLQPFSAYWIRVYTDCVITVPGVPASSSRVLSSATMSDGWQVRLVANSAGSVDGQNYIGQRSGAVAGEDLADIPKPPAGASDVYLSLINKGANGKNRALAFDMRSLGSNTVMQEEWVANVQAARPNARVVLSWDGIRTAPRNRRLLLTDVATGAVISMADRSSYVYQSGDAGSTRKFIVKLVPQASGVLAIRNLKTGATGRATGGLTVSFMTNLEADVKGVIETTTGRELRTLMGTTRALSGSETKLQWDGRNKDGAQVPAGPYVVKIIADTADGQHQVVRAMVQILK
jgi:subtilisin family serine protease